MKTDNENEEITRLATRLYHMVREEAQRITEIESQADNKLGMLDYDLRRIIEDSKILLTDYKDQGLTFNTVEAEGFHRAMLTIEAILDEYV